MKGRTINTSHEWNSTHSMRSLCEMSEEGGVTGFVAKVILYGVLGAVICGILFCIVVVVAFVIAGFMAL